MCVFVLIYAMCVKVPMEAREGAGSLEPELQVILICLIRVLVSKHRSSGERQALSTAEPSLQPWSEYYSN